MNQGGSSRRSGKVTFSLDEFHADPRRPTTSFWGCSMALEILKPGLSTTVQDLGRPGYYHLGIPKSGGMDHFRSPPPTCSSAIPKARRAGGGVQGPEIASPRMRSSP